MLKEKKLAGLSKHVRILQDTKNFPNKMESFKEM